MRKCLITHKNAQQVDFVYQVFQAQFFSLNRFVQFLKTFFFTKFLVNSMSNFSGFWSKSILISNTLLNILFSLDAQQNYLQIEYLFTTVGLFSVKIFDFFITFFFSQFRKMSIHKGKILGFFYQNQSSIFSAKNQYFLTRQNKIGIYK